MTSVKGHDLAVYSTRKTHTYKPELTHPCHSTEVKVHGLTKGTKSNWRKGRREERK